ncbi:uncharacterized protein SOCG_04725 [Schizosaccharomyces octosporus yFS286]|uniref:Fungal protein n=1 Tax=Schizosaccharomyces octosporus (strain yFS286) TaxID=483514 RepID=S9PMJ7_SCHOY|nr:uncharacterized protein SOCG_04725 [Schizosaccharomyces octosporus yFS286]EPX70481.1 fungal protein [Schizosaccharomyces octosporus yFS286]
MELDETQFDKFIGLFSIRPEDFPYNQDVRLNIKSLRQNHVDHQLFFDVLFFFIDAMKEPEGCYPPSSMSDLKNLFLIIDSSNIDELKQQCFYYYLLKDWGKSETYADQILLPYNFRHLIDGYYALDHLNFEEALDHFLQPDVLPNFPDKILETFYRHDKFFQMIRFIMFVNPPLDTFRKQECYTLALARVSFLSAFHFMKKSIHPLVLWEKLLYVVLDSNDKDSCKLIVSLPLVEEEIDIMISVLNAKKEPLYLNTLLAFLIQSGRIHEACQLASSNPYLDESPISSALQKLGVS